MKKWPINHLTAEDLDAFHSASLSAEARTHLDECAECRALALTDRALLDALATLPSFEPQVGFADRVMAKVQVAPRPVRRWQPVALAASLFIALGASVTWSLFNRSLLLEWLNRSASGIGSALWRSLRIVASNVAAQPWFAALGQLGGSWGRIAFLGGVLLLGYTAALFALRRLLSPSRPVANVNW